MDLGDLASELLENTNGRRFLRENVNRKKYKKESRTPPKHLEI